MLTPNTLADRVAVAIRLSGLKDAEVARRAEVEPDWLAGIKSRTRPNKNPDPKKLRRVAGVVGVPFRWFAAAVDWADDEEPTADQQAAAEQAILSSALSDEKKRAALEVIRALFR
jgi:transcriptional regulator with XRE-family HTH domain